MVTLLQCSDDTGVAAFTAIAPLIIEYAELKMQRDPDLDFLAMRNVDISKITTGGTRAVAIPSQLIVVEGVSLITPPGAEPFAAGSQRIPLTRTTRAYLDLTWPVESQVGTPDPVNGGYYALFSMQQSSPAPGSADEPAPLPSAILIAPTPDNEYVVEFTGTMRATPLSATNPTNFLSVYLPDLYIAASMIIASGYQRDFSAQANDPQMAVSWTHIYDDLKGGAAVEELRKKALSGGFSPLPMMSSMSPAPPGLPIAQRG